MKAFLARPQEKMLFFSSSIAKIGPRQSGRRLVRRKQMAEADRGYRHDEENPGCRGELARDL